MLARQQRLLVLDNFESLLGGNERSPVSDPVAVVLKILQAAPQVRIVVTSREVLGLQEEWIYDVRGLAYSAEESAAQANLAAVELFAQRARQAYLGFSLSAEMPHVLRICRLVEGLPLGIELAAAWVRTIPCADLAAAIEAAASSLVSPHRNRPHRHQNLEAVVACSWNLLGDEQRDALAGLGIFVGGFTRDTAEKIAVAPLRTLSALADKSLVRRRAEGRYDLHELVRQFANARLRSSRSRHAAVTKRHRDYFADVLLRIHADMRSPGEVAADALLRSEFANILAAWRGAIDAGATEIIERAAPPLIALLHTRGRLPEALFEAERAVGALGKSARADAMTLIRMQWGRAAVSGGRADLSRRELEAALAQARSGGKPHVIARCLYYLGALEYQLGNLEAAEAVADEALALGAGSEDAELRMLVHNLRGTLANMSSQFDAAEVLLRRGLDAARDLGAPSAIGGMLCSLGVPLYYQGKFDESAALNTEAARLYELLGKNATAITVRSNLAGISLAQGDLATSREHAQVAVRLSREMGDDTALAQSLANLGSVLLQQGELVLARSTLDECAHLAAEEPLTLTEVLYLLASVDLREGRIDEALANILRLRDKLASHRLDVRVPMLVLATADWILSSGNGQSNEAKRWLEGLVELDAIDATLRDKARALLADAGTTRDLPAVLPRLAALADIEREVVAFLAVAGAGASAGAR